MTLKLRRGVKEKGGVGSEGENETGKAEGEKENAGSREAAGRKREAGGKIELERKVRRPTVVCCSPVLYCLKILLGEDAGKKE
jgi:hypothetical protein